MKLVVYKAKDKYYTFRSAGGDGSLASAMGTVVFTVEHDEPRVATVLAQLEARKRNIEVEGL